MSTPPAVKRWWVTNLRGAAGADAALSPPPGLSPLGASSARTAAVVETNRVKRMASVALRMRGISLKVERDTPGMGGCFRSTQVNACHLFRPPSECATMCYMRSTEMKIRRVGVRELRQNLSRYLRLVAEGERFEVTEHNLPVAVLGPLLGHSSPLERLIAQDRIVPARLDLSALGPPPELPRDVIIPARLVVTNDSGQAVLKQVEKPQRPAQA